MTGFLAKTPRFPALCIRVIIHDLKNISGNGALADFFHLVSDAFRSALFSGFHSLRIHKHTFLLNED